MTIKKLFADWFGKEPGPEEVPPLDAYRVEEGGEVAQENPFLAARRTWNEHVGDVIASRQTWQVIGVLSLLIALSAVGGVIYIGSQSKFIPYVVEVDKHGTTVGGGAAIEIDRADPRVVLASISEFIEDARLVTPDVAMQRKAIYRLYAKLSPNDPGTTKMNEWLNGTKESNPFKRAEDEMVSIEIKTVLPQTDNTWQVDWEETTRDRQGVLKEKPTRMRALVTVYTTAPNPSTTEKQMRMNPLSIYVRDFSWSSLK
jgi:type IV secretion system protein VirB5